MKWLTPAIALGTIASISVGTVVQAYTPQGIHSDVEGDRMAQTNIELMPNIDLTRAKNLARQAAEEANGGLSRYRAEDAMHGPATEAPYVVNTDGSWTFTFLGGAPGSSEYTVESVVTVTPSGSVTVDYNGAIRPLSETMGTSIHNTGSGTTTTEDGTTIITVDSTVDLGRAKNLARQAAEQANGGLSRYRAEDTMHGPATEAPYVTNSDGSWTFTFLGGAPGSSNYTIESEITVTPTGEVTVNYNGAIR
jgi:hypothetical protein